MNSDYKKIIEKYLCTKDSGGYSIFEMLQKLLLFEICYETMNNNIISKNAKYPILNSYILGNVLKIGHTYTQITILGKVFDFDKRTLSFINLWKEIKTLLPQDDEFKKINETFEKISENKFLKSIKTARDEIICHNDSGADRNVEINIRECVVLAFKIYKYFASFIPNICDFLDYRSEAFLNYELATLSLPFFADDEAKKTFEDNYRKVLHDLGLKYVSESDLIKLCDAIVKTN